MTDKCATCGEDASWCRGTYDGRYCDGRCVYCKQAHDEYGPCPLLCEDHGGDCPEAEHCHACLWEAVCACTDYHSHRHPTPDIGGAIPGATWKRWDDAMRRWRAIQDANRIGATDE